MLIIFSVIWIFCMVIKFRVLKFREDFYSRVFLKFREFFTMAKNAWN